MGRKEYPVSDPDTSPPERTDPADCPLDESLVALVRELDTDRKRELLKGLLSAFPPVSKADAKAERCSLDDVLYTHAFDVSLPPDLDVIDFEAIGDPGFWLRQQLIGASLFEQLFEDSDGLRASRLATEYLRTMRQRGAPTPAEFDLSLGDFEEEGLLTQAFTAHLDGWRRLAIRMCAKRANSHRGTLRVWSSAHCGSGEPVQPPSLPAQAPSRKVRVACQFGQQLLEALPDPRREELVLYWLREGLSEGDPPPRDSGDSLKHQVNCLLYQCCPVDFLGRHGAVVPDQMASSLTPIADNGPFDILFGEVDDAGNARGMAESLCEWVENYESTLGVVLVDEVESDEDAGDQVGKPTKQDLWTFDFMDMIRLWRERALHLAIRGVRGLSA